MNRKNHNKRRLKAFIRIKTFVILAALKMEKKCEQVAVRRGRRNSFECAIKGIFFTFNNTEKKL